jgi:hypothetical protein
MKKIKFKFKTKALQKKAVYNHSQGSLRNKFNCQSFIIDQFNNVSIKEII